MHEATIGRGGSATRLVGRWPTALAMVAAAGVVLVIVMFANEADYFGASIATMAGIYLFAYGLGRPWSAWLAFVLLSALVTVLQFAHTHGVLPFDAPLPDRKGRAPFVGGVLLRAGPDRGSGADRRGGRRLA